MAKLAPKQSLLDYLWVNFGERGVATSLDSVTQDSIPSYGLIKELLLSITNNAVGSITKSGNYLIIKSIDGIEINRIDLIGSLDSPYVTDFGRRPILLEDIDKNAPYSKYTYVYYITLSNGVELTAPIEDYKGGSTKLIKNTILDGTIYSDLLISNNIKGVVFSNEEDGLAGQVYLEGSTKGIHFAILTDEEYDLLVHDSTTLYFIKDKPYMYFGGNKLFNTLDDLNLLELRLSIIENKIEWEEK